MTCTVCGGDSRRIAVTRNDFDLLRCVNCALVFCSPMPTPEDLDDYYQGFAYAKPDESELTRQVAYTEAGTRRLLHEIDGLSRRPIRKVLDFGGGLGFFANALSQHYSDVSLFDLDGHARDFARNRFPSRFDVLDDAESALSNKYDLILLNQVIEHVPDPVSFLHSFTTALEPGGLLVVTTPNNATNDTLIRPDVLWYYARRLKAPIIRSISLLISDSWVCCDPPRHLFSFNHANLVQAGERAGFQSLRTATSSFDQDPLGQPKYSFRGFRRPRSMIDSALFLGSKLSAWLGRALDPHGRKGNTLTAWFSIGPK